MPNTRLRFDVLDVVDGGGVRPLGDGDDAPLHLVRRHARIGEDHADDRNIDLRKDVGRHARDGHAAEQRDHERGNDEGIRAAKSETDDPHKTARDARKARFP